MYLKDGVNLNNANTRDDVLIIGTYGKQIKVITSTARQLYNSLSQNPQYFENPEWIPKGASTLSTAPNYRNELKFYDYLERVNGYYIYYSTFESKGGPWGAGYSMSANFALSKDLRKMRKWDNRKPETLVTYSLIDLSELNKSSNYDFLK